MQAKKDAIDPNITIYSIAMECTPSAKFLSVINENLAWEEDIN